MMIHQLLNLTRPLFVLDTETTGVDPQKDRIIELGFQQWTNEGMVKEWRSYINPQVPIPPSATKVHNITDDFLKNACRHCQALHTDDDHEYGTLPTFKWLAPSLAKGFADCDFAGQKVRFDLKILANEMSRAGQPWSYAGARIVDSLELERLLYPRDLSTLYAKYCGEGKPHDDAHGALSDVRASAGVIARQLALNGKLPKDLDALHELQWPGWLVADGSFRLVDGVATCMFGKHKMTPVKDIPGDYWDWLLNQNFPEDVRQVARDAKMGKYDVTRTV